MTARGPYSELIATELEAGRPVSVGVDRSVRGVILPYLGERWYRIHLDPDEVTELRPGGVRAETKFRRRNYAIQIPWAAVTYVETEETVRVAPRAIYRMRADDARCIVGDDEPAADRDEYEILDSLRRALRTPERFGGAWLRTITGPTFGAILDARPTPDLSAIEAEERAEAAELAARGGRIVRSGPQGDQHRYENPRANSESNHGFHESEREQLGVDRAIGTVVPLFCGGWR